MSLALRREWRVGFAERLGRLPVTAAGRPAVWIHGASVGEIAALAPVVRMLRLEFPEYRLVVSTLTPGGKLAAATRVPDADARVLFPFDLPWVTRRAVRAVAPRLVLFSETEIWPNFLWALAEQRVPAVMVSGRVSERAFRRYRRWRRLFAPALATVRWFCVQSRDTARRLVALGAAADRVVVTGSLKTTPHTAPAGALTLASLGVGQHPVLVAASTHAGEEDAVLAAWAAAAPAVPDLRLVIAPRRPERFDEVCDMLARRGVRFARRSLLGAGSAARWPADVPVLILDTLGELAGLFAGARVAFVGGTLAPIGGHNLLEPAAAGVAVVFGPCVEHAGQAARALIEGGGGTMVRDAGELAARVRALLVDAGHAREMGARARTVIDESQGALVTTLAIVAGTLRGQGPHAGRTP